MNERKALYLKKTFFVNEKTLYFRVFFVEDYREKEFFLLMKKTL